MHYRGRVSLIASYIFLLSLYSNICFSSSIKAFSLREANRLLEKGEISNRELYMLGGITRFAGMVFDRSTSDVILIGKAIEYLPNATIDDLIVALRSQLFRNQSPLVSIDIVEDTMQTGFQKVRFEGGIESTQFGKDFLDCDVVLKCYSLDLLTSLLNVKSYLKLYEDATKKKMMDNGHSAESVVWLSEQDSKNLVKSYTGQSVKESQSLQSRFWFENNEDVSYVTERDDVYVIDELRLRVTVETFFSEECDSNGNKISNPKDEAGVEFASQFTEHYKDMCSKYPILKRLKVLFDLVAISEGIAHLGKDRPSLNYLINKHQIKTENTQADYSLKQRVGIFNGKDDIFTLVMFCGGIELKTIILDLNDGETKPLKKAVFLSRPSKNALCWDLPLDEWKMPNDIPSSENQEQTQHKSLKTGNYPEKLGCAIGRQRFLFDLKYQGLSQLKFHGFLPLKPMKPLVLPPQKFNRLNKIGGVEINPDPQRTGIGGSKTKDAVIESRRKSPDDISSDIEIPEE